MKKRDNKGTHSVRTKVMTWVLTLVMLLGLIPVGAFHVAEAGEKEMWEIALENDYLSYTTVTACGGTGHLPGEYCEDAMKRTEDVLGRSLEELKQSHVQFRQAIREQQNNN